MTVSTRQFHFPWLFTKALIAPPVNGDVRVNATRGVSASAFAWKEFKA